MPFPVRALQVDGGSEFEAIFEEECQKRGIKLFVLPPMVLWSELTEPTPRNFMK